MLVERRTSRPDGWYRSRATYQSAWLIDIGRQIDPIAESARLRAMAGRSRYSTAGTASPGITGYQRRANAATAAIRTQVQISEYFADLLTMEAHISTAR